MGEIKGDFGGFEVWVYAPPREHHRRPHVHLILAEHQVSIALPTERRGLEILEATKAMPAHLIRRAARIVEANAALFRKEWDKLHGNR
jgi:hypothetical protein